MNPELILDRTEACRKLGISRQTLISWIRKGKLKVWKRVGHGSNAALLFEKKHIEVLSVGKDPGDTRESSTAALFRASNPRKSATLKQAIIPNNSVGNSENEKVSAS